MTQEEKYLLLIDLSARLPYGIICTDSRHGDSRIFNIDIEDGSVYYTDFDEYGLIENCKPYLRPISSITEEENELIHSIHHKWFLQGGGFNMYVEIIDFLNAHHFDFHNLIEKGLALEAPEGMYNIK